MDPNERFWDETTGAEEEDRYREIIRERVENSPFYQLIGMEITGLGPGWATFKMPTGKHLLNIGGIVHGGAITSIADAASGVALATLLEKFRERPITIELKINFCAPVVEGLIEARGSVIQKGGRIAVCEVDVTEGERLVAKGMSTYMILSVTD
ncbi:MAG TPA: PaaI family thioesterase [Candidatus Anoxymicrobiaceae bacterium]